MADSSTGTRQQVIDFDRSTAAGAARLNSPPAASAGRVSEDRRSLAVTPEIVEAPPAATGVIDRLGRCRSDLTWRLRGRGAGASDQRVSRTTLLRLGRWQFWIARRASIRSASIRSVCPVITTGRRTVRHMSNRVGIVVGLVESRILRRRRSASGNKRQAATQDKKRHHAAERRCKFQCICPPAGRLRAVTYPARRGYRAASNLPARPEGDPAPKTCPHGSALRPTMCGPKGRGPAQTLGAHHFQGPEALSHAKINRDNRYCARGSVNLQPASACPICI